MAKRIVLFILTNFLVFITISIVLNVLGVKPYLTAQGIDYQALMIFCFIWGMGGALVSLALSRISAKWMLGIKPINGANAGELQWLYNMIEQISKSAGLPKTPEVGVYQSAEVNAFATGPTKSRALVAFSTGLLQSMSRDEIEGVAAHEISHITNGDMVTMTLLQGIVNAFVMFFARAIAFAVSQGVKDEQRPMIRMLVTIVLDILLGILGMIVVAGFSRQREFRADSGSGKLVGSSKMIAALQALQRRAGTLAYAKDTPSLQTMKISSPRSKFGALFASHPALEDRIRALQMPAVG